MTDKESSPNIAALRKLESLHLHLCSAEPARPHALGASPTQAPWKRWLGSAVGLPVRLWRLRLARRLAYGTAALVVLLTLGCSALWWRLSSGPISLDLVTPWLSAAVAQNFGGGRRVEVGGTQIERDEHGRTALRIRDIVVRDSDGTVVASAPKAEVGVSGLGLLTGRVRAERLSLVGAAMSVRIEADGKLTVFAGADNRPIATASASPEAMGAPPASGADPTASVAPAGRDAAAAFAGLLAWIDGLGATGLDGHDLGEIGLKSGQLVVDDQRSGKRSTFENIDLSLTRPKDGGVVFKLGSGATDNPWSLSAAAVSGSQGGRMVEVAANKVPLKDLLLLLRAGDSQVDADLTLSGRLSGEIGPDGQPHYLKGQLVTGAGHVADTEHPEKRLVFDRAEIGLEWDAERRGLRAPLRLVSGGNRFNFVVEGAAPQQDGEPWRFGLSHGTIILGPTSPGEENLVLDRIVARVRFDANNRRVQVEQFDFGNAGLTVTVSGTIDYATSDSRMALGLAANRMSMATLKRLWPSFIAPKTRTWIRDRMASGAVERVVIATNMPLSSLGGAPIPEDGLSVEIVANGAVLAPVEELPPIRDADLNMQVRGRAATVTLARGTIELPSGRKLAMSNGTFEVADTAPPVPMSRTRFKLEGPVPAAAEFLALDRLRDLAGVPLDPATTRGTVAAQVTLGLPLLADLPKGSATYNVSMDITNFAAERMVLGHKVEAAALRATANSSGYLIKGDVKINGMPAAMEYRKAKEDPDAELRVQATLDDAARAKFGIESDNSLTGPVAVKIAGRPGSGDREGRFAVEADLTQAKLENLLPGWVKPAGKAARASFTLVSRPQSTRFEDLLVDGSGTLVKGAAELDGSGDIVSANFPVFSMSDGDKATLKAERSSDGVLRVTMRGDVYDGRGFLKSAMAGSASDSKAKRKPSIDLELDVKLGIIAGFHGEALRSVDLRLGRRNGQIRSFMLSAKLGRDTPLIGDMRGRGGGRQVLYFETNDAGALFRLTDTYPKISGGQMWVAMDPPTADQAPQEGSLNIRDFAVRGEAALERVASSGANTPNGGVEFSRMRVEFTKTPGRLAIRDGLVRGPVIGATIDGSIDFAHDDVRMRGTFVPLYGLNNMFGQIPIVGMFLGGSNEGLVGITYEVVGPPNAPVLRVNPISAVAPGVFRKLFEFPSASGRGFQEPAR
jgi:hypothetical protein